MKTYDYIVVGSGITGLTAARVLSQHHKSVLLLEKATILGGSLARFRMEGIPYDVGFHFTGGFAGDGSGVLDYMLALLGVRDQIRPVFFPREASHQMIFPSAGATYTVPSGLEAIQQKLKADFPGEKAGLDRYFKRFNDVVVATPTLSLSGFDDFPPPLSEDLITLQDVLDECVHDKILQTILGGLCMCYGTRPNEVSFTTHARVSYGLHESLARVEHGGDAFVDALVDVLRRDHVEIRTRTTIAECADIKDRKVGRFVLSDGSEVAASHCIFTIHPSSILSILPREHLSKAFQARVNDFEASNAFFTLYGALDTPIDPGGISLVSILSDADLNEALTCRTPEPVDGPMMVLRSREAGDAGPVHTVTALEVSFIETTQAWAATKLKRRPPEYYRYKEKRADSIVRRMNEHIPECRSMRIVDTASSLTYRDYLHSPDGSAYGIRQKIGQFNVVGRLPLKNLYVAGQSAILPGVLGTMMSALFVCRNLLGRDVFGAYLAGKPCLTTAQ
ncbi:MAG TPA: NAD(P)/FAD-dependent oxidoreductase [Tepidisphaeraceae bacterium]|jgi:phytoene dehydrogenase-like protein|nr:NAD(P)/FAD-dependent oxidoreductase [Tepidisphaeraceae bacterium]